MTTIPTENATQEQRLRPATANEVQGLWKHLMQRYGTRALVKHGSWPMELVAQALSLAGIVGARSFMRNNTTVVGRTIYTPFEVSQASAEAELWMQIVTAVHAHQHVVQQNREGLVRFMTRYIVSSAERARFEAEAYRCDMEMHFWRTGEVLSPKSLASRLYRDGCSANDIALAEGLLEASAVKVARGEIVNQASLEAIAWLTKHAPDLSIHDLKGLLVQEAA